VFVFAGRRFGRDGGPGRFGSAPAGRERKTERKAKDQDGGKNQFSHGFPPLFIAGGNAAIVSKA
jgi:hypothetical protein